MTHDLGSENGDLWVFWCAKIAAHDADAFPDLSVGRDAEIVKPARVVTADQTRHLLKVGGSEFHRRFGIQNGFGLTARALGVDVPDILLDRARAPTEWLV